MASIQSINMEDNDITLNLKISKKEYELLKQTTKNLILLPTDSNILSECLTTGKLGNSNRIMFPKKILDKHNIPQLQKKVEAKVFEMDNDKFLLIKIEESKTGIPTFKDD